MEIKYFNRKVPKMNLSIVVLLLLLGGCQAKVYWGICNSVTDQPLCYTLCQSENCITGSCIFGETNACICQGCYDKSV
jgi:hypothetical protein